MSKIIIKILAINMILLLLGCENSTENIKNELPDSPTITQGVWGHVLLWEGDFMPAGQHGTITPVIRKIYIYELTNSNNADQVGYSMFYRQINTKVVDSSWSNSKGFFQIALSEGEYSIFVKEDSLYLTYKWGEFGKIGPFTVFNDSLTELEFNIRYNTTN